MLISILPHKISHPDPQSSFINLKFPPWAPILIACILYYLMNEDYKLLLWIFVIIPQCLKIDTLRPQYTPLNTQIVKSIFFLIILLSTLPSIPHTHKQPTHIRQHTINQLNTHKLSTTNQFLLQSPTCPRHTPRITYTKPNTNYNIPHNTLLHYIGYLILWISIIFSKCTHIIYHQPISPQKDRHTTKTHHKVATQSRNMKSQPKSTPPRCSTKQHPLKHLLLITTLVLLARLPNTLKTILPHKHKHSLPKIHKFDIIHNGPPTITNQQTINPHIYITTISPLPYTPQIPPSPPQIQLHQQHTNFLLRINLVSFTFYNIKNAHHKHPKMVKITTCTADLQTLILLGGDIETNPGPLTQILNNPTRIHTKTKTILHTKYTKTQNPLCPP